MRSAFPNAPRPFLIHVRPAVQADLNEILSILTANWHEIHHDIAGEKLEALIEEKVRPLYGDIIAGRHPDRQLRIIGQHEQVYGFSCLGLRDNAHEIHAIYVAPAHRNRSMGAIMMTDIAECMMERDKSDRVNRPVHIRICNDNEGARQFAQKLNGRILHQETRSFMGSRIVDDVIGWHSPRDLRYSISLSNPIHGAPSNIRGGSDSLRLPAP